VAQIPIYSVLVKIRLPNLRVQLPKIKDYTLRLAH
jgi:hypothetical protein